MIYIAELTRADGSYRKHNGRPSNKFLKTHPEFVNYYECGKSNEYIYRTKYRIESGCLVEESDYEYHEREINTF